MTKSIKYPKFLLHTNSSVSKGDKLKETHLLWDPVTREFEQTGPFATREDYLASVRGRRCFAREERFISVICETLQGDSRARSIFHDAVHAEYDRLEKYADHCESTQTTPELDVDIELQKLELSFWCTKEEFKADYDEFKSAS